MITLSQIAFWGLIAVAAAIGYFMRRAMEEQTDTIYKIRAIDAEDLLLDLLAEVEHHHMARALSPKLVQRLTKWGYDLDNNDGT